MNKIIAGLMIVLIAVMCGCGGGGGAGPTATTVSGTASQGAPLAAGTTVFLKDSTGKKTTGTVGANGVYSVVVDGFTAPYVLNAGGFYSFASSDGITNINPFTHLCVQIALGTAAINDSSVIPPNFQTLFMTVVTNLKTQTGGLYQSSATVSQKDFLNGTIIIGAWVDKIFDNMTITAPNASGNFTVSVGGQQILTGANVNGVVVMTPMSTTVAYVGATLFPVATTTMQFTPAMVSGKIFNFVSSVNTTGSFTFNSDGSFSITNLTSGVKVTGNWSINAIGQLLAIVTAGPTGYIGEADIFSLTGSTATTFTLVDLYTVQSGSKGSLNATITFSSLVNSTPPVTVGGYTLQAGETAPTNLSTSMINNKIFYWGDAATKNYGEITVPADSNGNGLQGVWTEIAQSTFTDNTGWVATVLHPNAMPIILTSTTTTGTFIGLDTLNIDALGASYYVVSDVKSNSTDPTTYMRLYYGTNALANAKAFSGN